MQSRPTGQLDSPLEVIPEPAVIRARIASLSREQTILRKLLRVSEDRQRDMERYQREGNYVA
jgi:hypothetical protein